jgi:hypothetical protein
MIETSQVRRLVAETLEKALVVEELRTQRFDRDLALEDGVKCRMHAPDPTFAKQRDDLIGADSNHGGGAHPARPSGRPPLTACRLRP